MTTTATDPKLAALLVALEAIGKAATEGLASESSGDALDVLAAIESACRTATLEHNGFAAPDDPTWEERYALALGEAGELPEDFPF